MEFNARLCGITSVLFVNYDIHYRGPQNFDFELTTFLNAVDKVVKDFIDASF